MTIQIAKATPSAPMSTPAPVRNKTSTPERAVQDAGQEKVSILGQQSENLTYTKPRAIPDNLAAMLDESNQKVQDLLNLIRPLLEQQGLTMAKVIKGEQQISTDQNTIDAAKAAISEDGELGVRKVSERILSFAKFAMGDDPSKMQKIRDAIELGFSQAKDMLGGTLPDISQKTHDTIMAELDRWEKNGIPSGDTVSLAPAASA